MTTQNHKPVDTIQDGALKATIWKRDGEQGNFYTVDLSRTYKDDQGNYRDSHSFSGSEPLRIARLANIAYDEIAIHRRTDKNALSE